MASHNHEDHEDPDQERRLADREPRQLSLGEEEPRPPPGWPVSVVLDDLALDGRRGSPSRARPHPCTLTLLAGVARERWAEARPRPIEAILPALVRNTSRGAA